MLHPSNPGHIQSSENHKDCAFAKIVFILLFSFRWQKQREPATCRNLCVPPSMDDPGRATRERSPAVSDSCGRRPRGGGSKHELACGSRCLWVTWAIVQNHEPAPSKDAHLSGDGGKLMWPGREPSRNALERAGRRALASSVGRPSEQQMCDERPPKTQSSNQRERERERCSARGGGQRAGHRP